MGHVSPVAEAARQGLEVADVALHRLRHRALNVSMPDLLNVLLARQTQVPSPRDLDRETMTVPAGLAGDVEPFNRFET